MSSRSVAEARRLEPTAIVCFRQADVGEYLREVSPRAENCGWGSLADWSIGGYFVYDDVVLFKDGDMWREGNGKAQMGASRD